MKKLFFIALASIAFASCQKSTTNPTCSGTITISNNTKDPYSIMINNVPQGNVSGYSIQAFNKCDKGTYNMIFTQLSGYVFTPSIYTATIVLDCNDAKTVYFQ